MSEDGIKIVARNRKALHDFTILDKVEAGLVLMGSEIKQIRAGKANISEGFVQYQNGEMWLLNVHIPTYDQASHYGHEPLRPRKLLLHKKEIRQLQSRVMEKGITIVPLQIYLKKGRAKIELGLAKGKKNYDKRDSLRDKDTKRQIERALKDY